MIVDQKEIITKGDNNWYKGNATLTLTTSDKESGVSSYGMNTASSVPYNETVQMSLTYDTKSQTYYGIVKDRAGNVGTCSKTVKRDTVAPTCTVVPSGQMGNSGWYTGNVTLTLNETDVTSGVASRGISTSSSVNYNGSKTTTRTTDTTGLTYYGFVKDAAGNSGICSNTIKRDATKPTINCKLTLSNGSSYQQGTWSRSSLKGSVSASDTTSKVSQIQNNKSGSWQTDSSASSYTLNEGKHNYSFRAIDNAGNVSNTCSINGLVDWTPPTYYERIHYRDCALGSYDWYGASSFFGYNVTDNLSGVNVSTSIVEYCYTGHTASSCGATCSSPNGNTWAYTPGKVYGDRRYYLGAKFFEDGSNGIIRTAVSTNCVKGYSILTNYSISDKSGNIKKLQDEYKFPANPDGSCYPIG